MSDDEIHYVHIVSLHGRQISLEIRSDPVSCGGSRIRILRPADARFMRGGYATIKEQARQHCAVSPSGVDVSHDLITLGDYVRDLKRLISFADAIAVSMTVD